MLSGSLFPRAWQRLTVHCSGNGHCVNTTRTRHLSTYSLLENKKSKLVWLLFPCIFFGGYGVFKFTKYSEDYFNQINPSIKKEKIVIVGSSWGAVSCLRRLDLNKFDVTVVSPLNYFLFTPGLPDAVAGVVKVESITEPIRNFVKSDRFHFFEASVTSINHHSKYLECSPVSGCDPFKLEYDKLILAIGSVPNYLDVKNAVQYSLPLYGLVDSIKIRNEIISRLERANLPNTGDEEKRKLLHLVVVGGSPVSSNLVANLHDYLKSDIDKIYPHLSRYLRITMVHTKAHIRNFYDKTISDNMYNYFCREGTEVLFATVIKSISKNSITAEISDPLISGTKCIDIPFGICIWTVGPSLHPLLKKFHDIVTIQNNEHALVCDPALRVKGVEDVFAVGDCATIAQDYILQKFDDILNRADLNKDGSIDLNEYHHLISKMALVYPAIKAFDSQIFHKFDIDSSQKLSVDEFKQFLVYAEHTLTRFPQTATVAFQQGDFLARHLNKGSYEQGQPNVPGKAELPKFPEFKYKHLGGYEYVGAEQGILPRGSKGQSIFSGIGAIWMWKAVYFSKMIPMNVRFNLLYDWLHTYAFGSRAKKI
ncbi:uncharacterized protein LOC126325864 [Schistocerca gregaria]|uniref:uncharacterized protein LOC126325864 n=1 Tax=Schistocerca gregaria TaxID=7010 RepID=UPI00211EC9CD|nr:uncharacterized protein LOC126325864 [Schistocerca gregaria]